MFAAIGSAVGSAAAFMACGCCKCVGGQVGSSRCIGGVGE